MTMFNSFNSYVTISQTVYLYIKVYACRDMFTDGFISQLVTGGGGATLVPGEVLKKPEFVEFF